MDISKLLTVKQATERAGLASTSTVRKAIAEGKLKAERIEALGYYLITPEEFERWRENLPRSGRPRNSQKLHV